jgi:predicted DNA-binding ribbon-helix-helix protein
MTRIPGGRVTPYKVYIDGRETGVRLESVMWEVLRDIAMAEGATLQSLVRQETHP